jgi:3-oxo-5-alpha-steroid 4-dehydrogenase 1
MNAFSISWSAYQNIMFAWIGLAVFIFFLLLKVTAPYGRHTSSKWGPLVSNKYGWLFMEFPALIVLCLFLIPAYDKVSFVSWLMVGLFCFHYINRTFIFPFRLHTKGKKMPLVIVASGIFFNLVNGFSLGYYFVQFASYTNEWLTDIRFISGLIIFLAGIFINWKADNILISLRKPDETHYVIPNGWLFKKISCPNLLGELIEWAGFAILCWNLPALTFFIWTAANLIPRALSHHKWYKEKFKEYPRGRKAIIPFSI